MYDLFRRFAQLSSSAVGSAWAFLLALLVVALWGIAGPLFHYSNTWQLIMNTVSSVITFLMVFLIQSTQNREAKALQLKLNELLRGVAGARTGLVNLETLSEQELLKLQKEFDRISKREAARRADPQDTKNRRE